MDLAVEEARHHLHDVERSIRGLENQFTAADHLDAHAALTHAGLRHEGAVASLQHAEQALRSSDTRVAEVVADVLRRAMPDVATRATFVRPAEAPANSELPFLLVVQSTPATAAMDGTLSGEAEVFFFRSEIHRPLDASGIGGAAYDLGFRLQPIGSVHKERGGCDVLRVRLDNAHCSNPVIPIIEDRRLASVANRFASRLAANIRFHDQGIKIDSGTGAYVSSHIIALPDRAAVVSEVVDPNGNRVLTLDSSVLVRTIKAPTGRTVADEIDALITDHNRSIFIPGLGVVTTMNTVIESDLRSEHDVIRRRLGRVNIGDMPVDTANIGFETVHQIVFRTVLTSSAGAPATAVDAA